MTKVLVIEDEFSVRENIKQILEFENFHAVVATNGREGIALAKKEIPDLIICDIMMPEMDGYEVLKELRNDNTTASLPFIFLTAKSEKTDVRYGMELGADDYLQKPFTTEELLNAIKIRLERQAEAIAQSEKRFRSLVQNSSDIITIIQPDGKILYGSLSLKSITGYTLKEFYGTNIFNYIHPDDAKRFEHFFQQLVETKEKPLSLFEFRFHHADETYLSFEAVGNNFLYDPHIKGIVINFRNITERKKSEEKIREQAECLNATLDAIIVCDLENAIRFWNKGAEQLYGWQEHEVIGKQILDIVYGELTTAIINANATLLEKREWRGEVHQITKDGKELFVEGRWTVALDGKNEPKSIIYVNRDVTEKRKIESHFFRTQRMESLGRLASGIAHDLNNVLGPLLLSVQILKRKTTDEKSGTILQTLEASIKRGARMVSQILAFAKGSEGEQIEISLRHLIRDTEKIIQETFPPNITIQTECPKDLWYVMGDPTQLHQVFMNFFLNARDAMPYGGKIEVTGENTVIDDDYIFSHSQVKAGKYVVITITDTGTGIAPHIIDKIFDPYFTTKELSPGAGFGLTNAHRIIDSYGGFITVYSEMDNGSKFKIHLPAIIPDDVVQEDEKKELPHGNNELVLLVDDELPVLDITKQILENYGYRVLVAKDGVEAVAIFAQHQQEISLALIDMIMPIMDGVSTMRVLRTMQPNIKIIASSGLLTGEKLVKTSALKTQSFLTKPFSTEQLLTTMSELLVKS